ncbi:SDR family NAD(P)-dependent oxidoreductase [Thermodesulfobacteriota bacterium]
MSDTLKDKVAVITGGAGGLGRHISMMMAAEGAKVVVNDLGVAFDGGDNPKMSKTDEVVAEIVQKKGVAKANYDSVTTPEGANNIIKTAIDNYGRIDVLVNCAGFIRDRMLWNMTDDEFDAVIKVHVYGHFYCTRAAVIQMRNAIKEGKQDKGRIINFTSTSGIDGNPGQPNYSFAKMGVVGFNSSCALSLWRYGITSNTVCPLAFTPGLAFTFAEDKLRQAAKNRGVKGAESLPYDELGKHMFGFPESVSPLVCWLASDESQSVNGQVLYISTGHLGVYSRMQQIKEVHKDGSFNIDEIRRIMPSIAAMVPNPAEG